MYRALYRKYRPSDFSDVCGQPHIVRTLKNQINEGRLSHAYLFTGSRGTGKTSCAKILAKAVNCLNHVDGNPCNECEICRGIDNETIFDVTEIDAASNNGVDDIRELRDNSAFSPATAKYRVYIVDEVHMLSGAAFNALLKTLEEPPEHIIFILATTEVHKLPATILSRCQRFDFRRISPDDIAERLAYVADKEGFTLSRDAALLIGKLSDGAMRDALSLLDVCTAESNDINEQTVLNCAGLSGRQHLFDILLACINSDSAAALQKVAELYAKSKDFGRLCAELVEYLRDIMLIKTLRQPQDLLKCSADEFEQISSLADKMRLETVMHAIDVFESAGESMRSGAARRTAVETAVIKLCEPSLDSSVSALVRRIADLENGKVIFNAVSAPSCAAQESATEKGQNTDDEPAAPEFTSAPAVTKAQPTASAEEKAPAAPLEEKAPAEQEIAPIAHTDETKSGANNGAPIKFERWNDVLTALSTADPLMKAALGGSNAYINDEYFLIEITNASFRDMINNDARHRANLKKAIAAVTGKAYKIGPYTPSDKQPKPIEDDPLDALLKNIEASGLN